MLLDSLLPQLPSNTTELLIYITAGLGVILTVYSQFVEAENRRDLIRMIGALAVFPYALYIMNIILLGLSFGIFLASVIEFFEIYLGYHHHTRKDVQVYEYIGKKKK